MELTGKLKDKMAQAKDKDEAKEIMENAGMKLTDHELDTVAGGISYDDLYDDLVWDFDVVRSLGFNPWKAN